MDDNQETKVHPDIAPETKETLEEHAAPVETAFATPAAPAPAGKRRLKVIIAALVAAVLVLLIGGTVLGYTMWYQNPDKVVHDAALHAMTAKTISSNGTIAYTGDGFKMDITLGSRSASGNGELTVDAKVTAGTNGAEQTFSASGIGRVVDDVLYVKLSGIKRIVEDTAAQSGNNIAPYAVRIFDKIEDRWISIKASDYQEYSKDIATQQNCFLDLMEKMQSGGSMPDEVADVYRDNQILVIKEELGTKDINGTGSLGYKVGFDQDAAASFVRSLKDTELGKELRNCDDNINFEDIADTIGKEDADNEDAPVIELWASRFGHEITEIAIYGDTNGTDALNITLQPTFNEAISVEAPDDATSFKTVLEEIKQAITEYYSNLYSSGAGALPDGFDGDTLVPQLRSAV